ncbi:hypothetical protein LX73_0980 [Fodinibius salinus]|uniref:Uncharacterized protein n=1 Tax=Fodinibius salinus TaxID=860790 RepID=A0A5D3YNB2_9BACT|nr:hypothetical protein [Fodinibius salinus]TYP95665.1 hypothetical protein LX73_0980 [Fodinibius salinus]
MIKGHHKYKKAIRIGLLLVSFLLISTTAKAQFLDLNLQIDSKIATTIYRPLRFESLPTDNKQYNIELGGLSMGILSIRALEQQAILVGVNLPSQLENTNPSVNKNMPTKLAVRYGYNISDALHSSPLSRKQESIQIKKDSNSTPWNTVYLFIYGSLTTSNIPEGRYQNDLTIEITYL